MNDQTDLFGRGARARAGSGRAAARPGRHPIEHPPARVHAPTIGADHDSTERRRTRERLALIALRVGLLFGDGFMLSDIRHEALGAGVLTGDEGRPDVNTGRLTKPRELAWLGDLLPGLARDGVAEKLTIAGRVQFGAASGTRSHGNKNVLWTLTDRGRAMAQLIVDADTAGRSAPTYSAALQLVAGDPAPRGTEKD